MKALFEAIAYLFEEILFLPMNWLRHMDSWWGANTLNWGFMIIGVLALGYWLGQLNKYNKEGTEKRDVTGHSYLG